MIKIKQSAQAVGDVSHKIFNALEKYNDQYSPKVNYKKVVFYAEDEGEFVGGLDGSITWDNFEISNMVVLKRKQGIGTKLIEVAEKYAKENNITTITAWTLDFQAPDFYKKCGFETVAVVQNFAGKHACHHFIKRLK